MRLIDVIGFTVVLVLLLGTTLYQNKVINEQALLIQQMMTNPACNGRQ